MIVTMEHAYAISAIIQRVVTLNTCFLEHRETTLETEKIKTEEIMQRVIPMALENILND